MRLLLAALAVSALFSSTGAQGAGNSDAEAVATSTAAALARTLAPADLLISLEIKAARQGILALPTLDDDAKALEAEYPGLHQALWADLEPHLVRYAKATHPQFLSRLERLYAAELTEEEAQALLVFYRSPTGQKLLRTMADSYDGQSILPAVLQSQSGTITAEELDAATASARTKAVQAIGPADEDNLARLKTGISSEKFEMIGLKTQEITLVWVNEEDPEFERTIESVIETAMEKHIAERESAK